MNPKTILSAVTLAILWVGQVSAYEVWMGTHLMRHADATNLAAWSTVAPQLEGVNINRAPHDTDPASNNDWRTIIDQFTKAHSTGTVMSEIARSEVTKNPAKTNELAFADIDARLSIIFGFESTYGYDKDILMFYDNAATYQGTNYNYNWTEIEAQHIRDWLDTNGHADVELMFDVRNNSVANQNWALNPLVDHVMIEASATALLGNANNQITFANWFWTHPTTTNKRLLFQIPRVLPGDPLNQYEGTRRVVKMLGDPANLGYGEDGVRSDRLVILPVTYNDNYDYLPETTSGGTAYGNKLTSICLSLLEQRSLFEARTRLPTNADADSTTRLFGPTVSPIADQILPANTSTGPLPFTIGDDLTAPSALTLTPSSSDTNLVPVANIVLGGSDSNRTVTVSPVPGLSGSADISIFVSDGTLGTTETFTVTVLPPGTVAGTLYSDGEDCSIKEDPAIEKKTDPTVDLGARGSSPWVERCTVYVFPLPNLGAVSNPFTDATFTFDYISKGGSALRGHDLYGLGRRASSMVLTSDFYSQTATADPTDATRLQQSILTDSTPVGLLSTSAGGSANLVTYLNAQYAGGAGIGEYVFLRLNTRAPKTGISYATLTMSEGGVTGPPDTRPRIEYQAVGNSPPFISAIADQTIPVNTNTGPLAFTVGDDSTPPGSITLAKDSSNTSLVPVANIVFGGANSNRTVTVTPLPDQLGSTVISIIANDGTLSTTNTFNLTVTPPPPPPPEVVAGWDTWADVSAGGDTYNNTLTNGATGQAVGTADTSGGHPGWDNWGGSATHNYGASIDGTWGTVTDNPPSTAATGLTAAVGLKDKTPSGEMTFTITNTSGFTMELSGFHFDGVRVRVNTPEDWALSILAGSDVTVGAVTNGTIITDTTSPFLDREDVDIDLTGLADKTLENGEVVIFELAWTGGPGGTPAGGNNTMIDNVALSGSILPAPEPPLLEYSTSAGDMVFNWNTGGFKVQSRTNLTTGTWLDMPGGDTPPVNVGMTNMQAFFRLIQQ